MRRKSFTLFSALFVCIPLLTACSATCCNNLNGCNTCYYQTVCTTCACASCDHSCMDNECDLDP